MKARADTFTRRRLFIGAGGMASVLALAACGTMPDATTAPAAEEETETKAEEKTEMMETPVINIDEYFTETDGRHAPYLNTLKQAEEALNVKFNVIPGEYSGIWDRRKTAFAAGEADVDISMNQVNWVFFGGFNGMFIDHIPLMQRDKVDITRYYPADIKAWSWAGKLYAIPTQSGGELVLFNKQYFDEAGLNYPGGDWTYDDMIDMCQKVHKPDDNRWAVRIGQNSLFYMASTFMLNFGGEELTEDGNTVLYGEDPKSHAGAQFNVDLHLKHQFTPPSEVVRELLAGRSGIGILELGHIAMEFNGVFRYNASQQHLGEKLSVTRPPRNERGTATVVGNAHSIMGLSEVQDSVWELLKWLGSDEGATGSEYFGWTSWPSIIEHASHPGWASRFEGTNVHDAIEAWAEEGHNFLRLPEFNEAWGPLQQPWYSALRGEITVPEGLRESAQILQEIIDRRPDEHRE